MADRELLEAAARAAGVEGHFCAKKELDTERWGIVTFLGYGQAAFWNPLTDDGDALRLAVKLGIEIGNYHQYGRALAFIGSRRGSGEHWEIGDDPCAATRRAITRAAAEIGRAEDGREP